MSRTSWVLEFFEMTRFWKLEMSKIFKHGNFNILSVWDAEVLKHWTIEDLKILKFWNNGTLTNSRFWNLEQIKIHDFKIPISWNVQEFKNPTLEFQNLDTVRRACRRHLQLASAHVPPPAAMPPTTHRPLPHPAAGARIGRPQLAAAAHDPPRKTPLFQSFKILISLNIQDSNFLKISRFEAPKLILSVTAGFARPPAFAVVMLFTCLCCQIPRRSL